MLLGDQVSMTFSKLQGLDYVIKVLCARSRPRGGSAFNVGFSSEYYTQIFKCYGLLHYTVVQHVTVQCYALPCRT